MGGSKRIGMAAVLCALVCATTALAQNQPTQPMPSDEKLAAFVVGADNTVAFRFMAPEATSVQVHGDWPGGLGGDTVTPMTRDGSGLWSVTVGPLESDLYHFSFVVNGVEVTPPPITEAEFSAIPVLPGGRLTIPGGIGDDFTPQDVPHGTLARPYAPLLDATKQLTVYLPPGYYENPDLRYPTLYLSGYPGAWEEQAQINVLLDNMIASGRVRPMIAVVLDPKTPEGNSLGWTSFEGGGNQTGPMFLKAAQAIADQIVPWVDQAFRTIPDRDHRAITGFSSPGSQGFLAGATNPQVFASIGAFSGGFPTWPEVGVQIASTLDPSQFSGPDLNRIPDMDRLGALIPDLDADADMRLVYLSAGLNEPLIQTHALMLDFLAGRGVEVTHAEQPGYTHEWRSVRWSLRDFLPRLFP